MQNTDSPTREIMSRAPQLNTKLDEYARTKGVGKNGDPHHSPVHDQLDKRADISYYSTKEPVNT